MLSSHELAKLAETVYPRKLQNLPSSSANRLSYVYGEVERTQDNTAEAARSITWRETNTTSTSSLSAGFPRTRSGRSREWLEQLMDELR